MVGPFEPGQIKGTKVNGFISIKKPNGARRQVGNLSDPSGLSFNENINPAALKRWKVKTTTSSQFAEMLMRAGKNAIMSCSDMTNAYKNLPVTTGQRCLQVFKFWGKHFVDLRLIFGDKCACMFFDRFHHCILWFFVWPEIHIPVNWVGRTIDDVTTVSPGRAQSYTSSFVSKYREILSKMNIGAAPDDPSRKKAFDGATKGEVLGIVFNSEDLTWQLPQERLSQLIGIIDTATEQTSKLSLHEVEVLFGKLVSITQIVPPLNLLLSEILLFLVELIENFLCKEGKKRDAEQFLVPKDMHRDLKTTRAILQYSKQNPLPLVELKPIQAQGAMKVWSDVSGHIIASPSLGLYMEETQYHKPLIASLALPRCFLQKTDTEGKKAFCKTTMLECLAYLTILCLEPLKFIEEEVLFYIDNMASVIALQKGRSGDPWATTIVRAARVVAAALGCSLFAEWEKRRSSRGAQIADDLTHNLVAELDKTELESYMRGHYIEFPKPICSGWQIPEWIQLWEANV